MSHSLCESGQKQCSDTDYQPVMSRRITMQSKSSEEGRNCQHHSLETSYLDDARGVYLLLIAYSFMKAVHYSLKTK